MTRSRSSSACERRRCADHRSRGRRDKVHGPNRKVSNLVNMATRMRHDVVVVADSDMRVDPDYLSRVVAALRQRGVGAVTCLYHGVALDGDLGPTVRARHQRAFPAERCRRPGARPRAALLRFDDCVATRDPRAIGGFEQCRRLPRRRLRDRAGVARPRLSRIAIPPFARAHMCGANVGWRTVAARAAMGADDPEHRSCSVTRARSSPIRCRLALIAIALAAGSAAFCRQPASRRLVACRMVLLAAGGTSVRPSAAIVLACAGA